MKEMRISEQDKKEFCYLWRLNFSTLSEGWYPHPKGKDRDSVKWLAALARANLGYSKKTVDVDIVHTLHRIYRKLPKQ